MLQGSKRVRLQCRSCGRKSEDFLVLLMKEEGGTFYPRKGWDWLRRQGWWLDDELELNLPEAIIYGTCPACHWQRRRTAKVVTKGGKENGIKYSNLSHGFTAKL